MGGAGLAGVATVVAGWGRGRGCWVGGGGGWFGSRARTLMRRVHLVGGGGEKLRRGLGVLILLVTLGAYGEVWFFGGGCWGAGWAWALATLMTGACWGVCAIVQIDIGRKCPSRGPCKTRAKIVGWGGIYAARTQQVQPNHRGASNTESD